MKKHPYHQPGSAPSGQPAPAPDSDSLTLSEALMDNVKASAAAAQEASGSGEEWQQQLEQANQEIAQLKDRALRIQADFDNYRKRVERERGEQALAARVAVLREFLGVLDAIDRALKALPAEEQPRPETAPFRVGLELIHKQFMDILARFRVEAVPAVGLPFDPRVHHALLQEDSTTIPEQHIIEEFQRGFLCEGRLLRPAQVKVSGRGEGSF